MQGGCIVKNFSRKGVSLDTAMPQVTSYAMCDIFNLSAGTISPMVMRFFSHCQRTTLPGRRFQSGDERSRTV